MDRCGIPFVLAICTATFACGGTPVRSEVYGEEEIVEASRKEKPEWLGAPKCPSGRVCAQGTRTRAAALEHARTDAQNDAIKDFGRRLRSKAESKFGNARQEGRIPELGETPEVDQRIEDIYGALSKVTVEDLKVEDFFWRKVRSLGEDHRYHYYFDYDALVSIPERTWNRKVKDLLDEQRRKAQEAGQQALAKEIDGMFADLEKEEGK